MASKFVGICVHLVLDLFLVITINNLYYRSQTKICWIIVKTMCLLFIFLLSLCVVSNGHYSQKHHTAHHNLTFHNRPSLGSSLKNIVINLFQLSKTHKGSSSLSNCSSSKPPKPSLLNLALLLLSNSKDIEPIQAWSGTRVKSVARL